MFVLYLTWINTVEINKYIGAQGNYMTEKSGMNHILGYHIENEMYALHETNQSR